MSGYVDLLVHGSYRGTDQIGAAMLRLTKDATTLAVREEVAHGLPDDVAALCVAALRRLLETPLKRKHLRRTVNQALAFVAREDGPANV